MIVDETGVEVSDSARLPLPIYELEFLESEARWDDLIADELWFQEHEAEMRRNISRGLSF